jgi:hypothetical protein
MDREKPGGDRFEIRYGIAMKIGITGTIFSCEKIYSQSCRLVDSRLEKTK